MRSEDDSRNTVLLKTRLPESNNRLKRADHPLPSLPSVRHGSDNSHVHDVFIFDRFWEAHLWHPLIAVRNLVASPISLLAFCPSITTPHRHSRAGLSKKPISSISSGDTIVPGSLTVWPGLARRLVTLTSLPSLPSETRRNLWWFLQSCSAEYSPPVVFPRQTSLSYTFASQGVCFEVAVQ